MDYKDYSNELKVYTFDENRDLFKLTGAMQVVRIDNAVAIEWKRKGITVMSSKAGNQVKNKKLCIDILEAYINTLEEE